MDTSIPTSSLKSQPLASGGGGIARAKPQADVQAAPAGASVSRVAEDLGSSSQRSGRALEEHRLALEKAIEELRTASRNSGRELGFRVDATTDRAIVTVSDAESGKVIRQIPDEVVIRVAQSIEQLKGLLFDESL